MQRAYGVMKLQEKCEIRIAGGQAFPVDFKKRGDSIIGFLYTGTNKAKLRKAFPGCEIMGLELVNPKPKGGEQ